jgi:small-conductance mechanosensitive channel/tellurite resistance protein/CRP-like cAMP-binding protein
MDLVSSATQVLGLLALLAAVALVFVRLIGWAFGRKGNKVRLGAEMILAFTIAWIFDHSALGFLSLEQYLSSADRIIALLWWLSVAFTLDAAIKRFIWNGLMEHGDDRHVPKLLQDVATALIYAVAIMIVMHFVFDEPITAVLATSGAAAFVIGFSAQSTLGEIFSGLSLNATRALRVGDYLEIDGIYGRVHDINWRSVSLHNPHTDSLYVFPNSVVASSVVLNYSVPTERFKNTISFVVEHSASPELVIRLITEKLKNTRFVRRNPAPDFNIMGFTDLGMEYRLRYYFDGDDPWWDAQNEICTLIWSTLRRNGIKLGIDRHKLQTGDELASSPWTSLLSPSPERFHDAVLKSGLLSNLDEEQIKRLSAHAVLRDYSPPDCVYQKDDQGSTLFLVEQGRISITHVDNNEVEMEIFQGGPGSVFGLSGALGENSRDYLVQALQYSLVFELNSEDIQEIVRDNKQLKRRIDDEISMLQQAYKDRINDHLEKEQHKIHHHHRNHLMGLLRDHVGQSLGTGFFTSIWHAIFPNNRKDDLLDALMAASALVVMADGDIDDKEHDLVLQTLASADILHNMDRGKVIQQFDHHLAILKNEGESGVKRSLDSVAAISGDPNLTHLVIAICHGIHGPDGTIDDHEHKMIVRIADTLGVSPNPEEIGKEINSTARTPYA